MKVAAFIPGRTEIPIRPRRISRKESERGPRLRLNSGGTAIIRPDADDASGLFVFTDEDE